MNNFLETLPKNKSLSIDKNADGKWKVRYDWSDLKGWKYEIVDDSLVDAINKIKIEISKTKVDY
jgi:hypothetical protein